MLRREKGFRYLKKGEYVILKFYEREIESSFLIHADFESILTPENNRKQNPDETHMDK